MTSPKDSEDPTDEKVSDLLKANHELSKDVCMLKQLVYCLNSQLGRYQKLYFLNQKSRAQSFPLHFIPPLPESGSKSDNLESRRRNVSKKVQKDSRDDFHLTEKSILDNEKVAQEVKFESSFSKATGNEESRTGKPDVSDVRVPENWEALPALLDAYEETIKEKDFIIKEYERKMLALGQKCRAVVLENEALHNEREKWLSKSGVNEATSKSVGERLVFVEEQNKLLKEFLDLEKDKLKEIQEIYEEKISDLTDELRRSKDDHRRCMAELSDAKGRCNFLADEVVKLRKFAEDSIPRSVHNESINECRRLLEELKMKYERDNQSTLVKLKEIECAKMKLMNEVAELTELKNKSERLMKTKEHLQRRYKQKCIQLCVRLTKSEKQNEILRENLRRAVSLLGELSMDRGREESNEMIDSSMQERVLLLRSALQKFQQDARRELDSIERRLHQKHKKKKSGSHALDNVSPQTPPISTAPRESPVASQTYLYEGDLDSLT